MNKLIFYIRNRLPLMPEESLYFKGLNDGREEVLTFIGDYCGNESFSLISLQEDLDWASDQILCRGSSLYYRGKFESWNSAYRLVKNWSFIEMP